MRIVHSFKQNGVTKHRTVHSLGKVEDYPLNQLQRIGEKIIELCGTRLEDIVGNDIREIRKVNYGYALIIKELCKRFSLNKWVKRVNNKRRIRFDWFAALELMIAERLNEPCSKRACHSHQIEYLGFGESNIDLHHLYRTLDLLSQEQESLKAHLFNAQQSLFSTTLDVVFYDVTTLYFDSQVEDDNSLRAKGFSKDGKAHKTQIVLGLLVDKLRNPISYNIYRGNTYEGKTMIDALEDLKSKHKIDKVIAVADSAMIDKSNRDYMKESKHVDYIIGDRIKNLPAKISSQLINRNNHKSLSNNDLDIFSFTTIEYQGRKIICTYSAKRARKDQFEREKLINKAVQLLAEPSQLKQSKKRGAGRFIKQVKEEQFELDITKIKKDKKWDGFKAISTTSNLGVEEVLSKYSDLFEVEHAFRTLKSQLQIRPIFHWTNQRIEGHIAMCFIAYAMLNYLRITTGLQNKQIIRSLDHMLMSEVKETKVNSTFYLRSAISKEQERMIKTLKLIIPKDTTPQNIVYQYFN